MAFKNRRRSLQAFHPSSIFESKGEKGSHTATKVTPLPSPVENVPSKQRRPRTASSMAATGIMRRVSTMFSSKRKAPAHLDIVDSNHNLSCQTPESILNRQSVSSRRTSIDSEEDDIRRPSGLGRAVSIMSNRSLPPSPFTPHFNSTDPPFYSQPGGEYIRSRALSSPNLLRSRSGRGRGSRRSSVSQPFHCPTEPVPPVPPIHGRFIHIPEEIVGLIFSHLSRSELAVCAPVSQMFCAVARATLYASLDLNGLSSLQFEKLVAVLASRRDLTDLVTAFALHEWPTFFILESQTLESSRRPIEHHDALLTATFTLAFERMSNLSSLALPSFEIGLLGRHTAFGLRSLTFFTPSVTDAERKALFTWLDGQTNITALKFPCLQDEDASTTSKPTNSDTERQTSCPSSPQLFSSPSLSVQSQTTPPTSVAHSPLVQTFSSLSSLDNLFSSPTLLPNLSTLHATPTIVTMLAASLESGAGTDSDSSHDQGADHQRKRPLNNVTLNINTTLFGGLRPGALMNALQGVKHLSLRFGESMDRRTFEKIMGAATASLGSASDAGIMKGDADLFVFPRLFAQAYHKPRSEGLVSLEILVHPKFVGTPKGEALIYKTLQASIPRFKMLSRLCVSYTPTTTKDQRPEVSTDGSKAKTHAESWIKGCPCLSSITLFSDYQWCRP